MLDTDVGVTYGAFRSAVAMIIRVRRRLLKSPLAHRQGTVPPGVDEPEAYRRRGVQLRLAPGSNWYQLTEDMLHEVVTSPPG